MRLKIYSKGFIIFFRYLRLRHCIESIRLTNCVTVQAVLEAEYVMNPDYSSLVFMRTFIHRYVSFKIFQDRYILNQFQVYKRIDLFIWQPIIPIIAIVLQETCRINKNWLKQIFNLLDNWSVSKGDCNWIMCEMNNVQSHNGSARDHGDAFGRWLGQIKLRNVIFNERSNASFDGESCLLNREA